MDNLKINKGDAQMITAVSPIQSELILVGGGHANVQVLKAFAMRPILGLRITLISDVAYAPYSGMLPGFVAGRYQFEEMHINLYRLCNFANARFVHTKIKSIDTKNRVIQCQSRPDIAYDLLSINTGITPDYGNIDGAADYAVAVKPISQFLSKLVKLDNEISSSKDTIIIIGAGAAGIELAFAFRARFNKKNLTPKIIIIGKPKRFFLDISVKTHSKILQNCTNAGIDVYHGDPVIKLNKNSVILKSGVELSSNFTFLVTGAKPSEWLKSSSLNLTNDGFIEVNSTYQTSSDDRIFAAGDIAKIIGHPRPRSGVFAVRAGPVLAKNLRLKLHNSALQISHPQLRYLSLITLHENTVLAIWNKYHLTAKWLSPVKQWIDKKFISNFNTLPTMQESSHKPIALAKAELQEEEDPLLEKIYCTGCGAKAGSHILDIVLPNACEIAEKLGANKHYLPNLHTFTDAGEFPLNSIFNNTPDTGHDTGHDTGQVLTQTIDSISQMVSDPFLFGKIAALHALSDLFVSNATPLTALSLINIQRAKRNLQQSDLTQMLAGAMIEMSKAKTGIIGGHTSQSHESSLGFAITGLKNQAHFSNIKAQIEKSESKDWSLILTKPIGVGLILAAEMRNEAPIESYEDCINSMLISNQQAAHYLWQNGAVAMTDVTGFGLAKHMMNITQEMQIHINLDMAIKISLHKIPILSGVKEILRKTSIRASLHQANKRAVQISGDVDTANAQLIDILFDPQTSGGIVAAVPTSIASQLTHQLQQTSAPVASIIGTIQFNQTGIILRNEWE